MEDKVEERLIRLILSSILSSDFTRRELRSISKSLNRDDSEFSSRLARTISDTLKSLDDNLSPQKNIPDAQPTKNSRNIEQTLSIIKRKRLSKHKILLLINRISPSMTNYLSEGSSMREILNDYFSQESFDKINLFFSQLNSESALGDDYLEGIIDKSYDNGKQ